MVDGHGAPVLVVEDDPGIRDALSDLLAYMGVRVEIAEDGEAAWALLDGAGLRPGLVLLDLFLPRLDGLALLGRVRADARLRALVVVTMSAAVKERPPGADDHLEKPFDLERLRRLVLPHCHRGAPGDPARDRGAAPVPRPRPW